MCGFCGYINKKEKNKEIINEMSKKIIHRGPDSEGLYTDDYINMAFRRLSIIDLNTGSQPIYNEDKTLVILFNGEIYNYQELKKDLIEKGHKFTTETDTEVILHGYEEYSEHILDKLRGMFAFVIWNTTTKELFAARDIFGIKPFYYTIMNNTFMFASEIKAFLPHPDFIKEVNPDALKAYLTFQYNPLNETFFKDVFKLPPRHYLKYKDNKLYIKEYYSFNYKPNKKISLKEMVKEIDEVVKSSVDYHKISDVKVGAFLSSGVDSSYIVSLLKPNTTFTVGFKNLGFNEIDAAKNLSNLLKIENKSEVITPEEFFAILPKVQYHSDEPHANLSSVPLYFLSKLAKKDVTVVLSGEGADELFGGYQTYDNSLIIRLYRHLPACIRKFNLKIANKLPNMKGKSFLIRGSKTLSESYIGQANIFTEEEANDILASNYKSNIKPTDITKPYFDEVKGLDEITKMQYVDMNLWLPNDILLKADKMTMANSLELRVPYLDKKVFELSLTLPKKYKLHKKISKYALRLAAKTKIPKEWFNRPKLGFLVPFKEYLKDTKYYNLIKNEFKEDYVKKFFNQTKILNLLEENHGGTKNNHREIYTIYSFLLWYKEYFINN